MKKLIVTLVFSVSLLALAACSNGTSTLEAPENLTEDDLQIVWDAVEDAESYIVEVDGEEHIVSGTSYSLHDYDNGSYDIRVKAMNNDTESDFTDSIKVDVSNELQYPSTFSLDDDTLEWEDLEADSYIVEINGETDTVDTNSYTLENDDASEIRVKAMYDEEESVYSRTITIQYLSLETTLESDKDLLGNLNASPSELEIENDQDEIQSMDYSLDNNLITFDHESLDALGEGSHTVFMRSDDHFFVIEMDIDDESKSKILSNTTISYVPGNDVVIQAETFGEGIHSLSGVTEDELQEDEYSIDEDRVTVDHEYFDRLFEAKPDRSTVVMQLTLNSGDGDIIVFTLFVNQ